MNRLVVVLSVSLAMLATPVFAANNSNEMDDRRCNLQAREIALRISEELGSDYTAAEREAIGRIAQEVCQDYSAQNSSLPVINRPAGSQAGPQAMPMSTQDSPQQASSQRISSTENQAMTADAEAQSSDTAAEEENDGILGGLKIIDAQDRVRRPGLKRR